MVHQIFITSRLIDQTSMRIQAKKNFQGYNFHTGNEDVFVG